MHWKANFLLSNLGQGMILVLFLLVPISVSNDLMFPTQTAKFFIFSFGILIISAIFAFSVFFGNQLKTIKLSPIDASLFLFIVYAFSHLLIYEDVKFATQYWELAGLGVLYIIIRNYQNNYLFFFTTLLIAVIIQAIYGNLQLYGFLPSHHNLFNMTGSFFNPGPYAGFLVSGLIVAVCIYLFRIELSLSQLAQLAKPQSTSRKLPKVLIQVIFHEYIPLIAIITVMLVLPASKSRAAWLGTLVAVGYLFFLKYSVKDVSLKHFSTRLKKTGITLLLIILVAGGVFGVYYLKKDSADGRLLIWKVTSGIVKDKPISGHGYGQFPALYMNYQAAYFKRNPDCRESSIAGNNVYAFNEFFRITTEAGIIGLILSLAVLFYAIYAKLLDNISGAERIWIYAARSGIIAVIVFGCFSYPGKILPIRMNIVFFLAIIAKLQKPIFFLNKTGNVSIYSTHTSQNKKRLIQVVTILLLASMYFPAKQLIMLYIANKEWKSAYTLYHMAAYNACLDEYSKAYPQLKNNGDFLVNYGKALSMAGKHKKAIEMLDMAQDYLNNSIVFTALGDSYKALSLHQQAEQAYKHAWYMIPSRFYPKYLLAKLYDETGQMNKAIMIAKELLHKEVKIESNAIEEIKEEMRNIILKYQSHIQ